MRRMNFCGRETAVIALGTMDYGGKIEAGRAREFMDAYRALGGDFIDTARIYGDFAAGVPGGSERVIGRWMEDRANRAEIFLSTKGGHPVLGRMHEGRLSRGEIGDDLARSLENLRTDRVDIYWLHRDDPSRPVGDIMETLTGLVEDGYTRLVGVSNWTTPRIAEAEAYAQAHGLRHISANQPQFSLARQVTVEDDTLCQMDAEMAAFHKKSGMICVPFSSQAKGFLSKMDLQGEAALTDKARRRYFCEENLRVLRNAQALKAQTGHSVAALSLGWLTAQPFPTFPIAGASRMEQIAALQEAAEVRLTPEQRAFLREI